MQRAEPGRAEYLPEPHCEHVVALSADQLPAGHGSHDVALSFLLSEVRSQNPARQGFGMPQTVRSPLTGSVTQRRQPDWLANGW